MKKKGVLKQGVISEKKVKSWNWVCHSNTERSKGRISEGKKGVLKQGVISEKENVLKLGVS